MTAVSNSELVRPNGGAVLTLASMSLWADVTVLEKPMKSQGCAAAASCTCSSKRPPSQQVLRTRTLQHTDSALGVTSAEVLKERRKKN